ncbi:MAG: glutamine synthetase type III, partial [Lachnospiraceae bacterium]|nr:glutamine synthetase type III [Lachnospiraceae bacterium]
KEILPAVAAYTGDLANTVLAVKEAGGSGYAQSEMLVEVDNILSEARKALKNLEAETVKAAAVVAGKEKAYYYRNNVVKAMDDKLEKLCDASIWPIPTYGELMFEV